MKFFDFLKSILKKLNNIKKQSNSNQNVRDIAPICVIPEYEDLKESEKEQVDQYFEEIDFNNLEDIILYGDTISKKSRVTISEKSRDITELLVNLSYETTQNTEEIAGEKLTDKPLEDILESRLNILIAAKQLAFYSSTLQDLFTMAKFKTVALEKFKHSSRRPITKLRDIFSKSENSRRNTEEEQIDKAIDRMRYTTQLITSQLNAVSNDKKNVETIRRAIEIYKQLIPEEDSRVYEITKRLLKSKKAELLDMARVVIPDQTFDNKPRESEEDEINELVDIKLNLDIYAQQNKEEIDVVRRRIEELNVLEKSETNRDELLKEIKTLEAKYKVFGRRIQEEDWQALYQVKFDILTLDINQRKESPFDVEHMPEKELECYKKILDDKIESLMSGENPELTRAFGKQKAKAIKIIRDLIIHEKKFDILNILQNPGKIALILAFDKAGGLERIPIREKSSTDTTDLGELIWNGLDHQNFEWEEFVPLKSIFKIFRGTDNVYREIQSYDESLRDNKKRKYNRTMNAVDQSRLIELYEMYNEPVKEQPNRRTLIMPEGITAIHATVGPHSILRRFFSGYEKIVFPSTLRSVDTNVLNENQSLYEVDFNNGLERIGEAVFKGCFNFGKHANIDFPASLKEIGDFAFYDCPNMGTSILKEGLEKIGDRAFWCDPAKYEEKDEMLVTPTTLIAFPSTIKDVGKDVVNMRSTRGYTIGFRNYKGQDIPKNILELIALAISKKVPQIPKFSGEYFDEAEYYYKEPKLNSIAFFKDTNLDPYFKIPGKDFIKKVRKACEEEGEEGILSKVNMMIKEEYERALAKEEK